MKKLSTALAALFVSTSTFAYDYSYPNNACNLDVNGGVSILKSDIEFSEQGKNLYKIINNNILVVNGREVYLSPSQEDLVIEFSTGIRALVPQAKDVATSAVTLASEGVSLVFNELLGENNTAVSKLSSHFYEINTEIEKSLSMDETIYIDENGFSDQGILGEQFEKRFEETIEEVVQNSIGSLMMAVGQELIFSGGDMQAFESKMDRFGEQLEQQMEIRSEEIENSAHALCESLIKVNAVEDTMRSNIKEIAEFDMLSVSPETASKA